MNEVGGGEGEREEKGERVCEGNINARILSYYILRIRSVDALLFCVVRKGDKKRNKNTCFGDFFRSLNSLRTIIKSHSNLI